MPLLDKQKLANSIPHSIYGPSRSTSELLTIEADLAKRGIGLVIFSMGGERLDTRNPTFARVPEAVDLALPAATKGQALYRVPRDYAGVIF